MKKAAIITYHFANNYGAILQCYALQHAISNIGHQCEVVNFVSEKQEDNNSLYRKYGLKNQIKNILLLPFHTQRLMREKRIHKFLKEHLSLSPRIKTIEELEAYITANDFNYLFSGSDQVWNPMVDDFNQAFFYPFKTTAKKIGYAVSIGKASASVLFPYKKWIREFETITVREETSISVVSELAGKQVKPIVDPVFLLSAEEWKTIIRDEINQNKYVVAYFVKTDDLDRKVKGAEEIANRMNCKLIIISPRITKYNLNKTVISDAGPLEFLSLLKNSQFVYTDSFHGTVFSIILNKQFSTIERLEDSNDSRKTDILKKVGLLDRVQYVHKQLNVFSIIDYDNVNKRVNEIQLDALTFLNDLLE
ncbi:MAG: polysaccharide pyruvyl transferase family protein [Anaerolineaceae bacterium]|nr:polysaccharide pyruvyl transferase family protein [Anaerolineaceae bacterium]